MPTDRLSSRPVPQCRDLREFGKGEAPVWIAGKIGATLSRHTL